MTDGYAGYRLAVDLSTKKAEKIPLREDFLRGFLGGAGFGIKTLYEELAPGIDPLSPDNMLIFSTGPAQGVMVNGGARNGVISKSPANLGSFRSLFGGFFGFDLKKAGYDFVSIRGKLEKPGYLFIRDDGVDFKDGSHIWGKRTYESQTVIKEELRDKSTQVAVIGPAGEHLVMYASIHHEHHSAGRGGLGAVMGSKNLKAVAVKGTHQVPVHDKERVIALWREIGKKAKENVTTRNFTVFGTPFVVAVVNKIGGLATRNWQQETFEGWEKIAGETTLPKYKVRDTTCGSCTITCEKIQEVKEGQYAGAWAKGPEYETLFSLGSCLGVDDFEAIVAAAQLCDDLGMDTISAGVTMAFAIECLQRDLINREHAKIDGSELKFGEGRAIVEFLKKTAYRDGWLANLMAEGARKASQIVGQGSEKFAMHVKGIEIAGHSPRAIKGAGLGYATANRGGSHQDARPHTWDYGRSLEERAFTTHDKPYIVYVTQNTSTIGDSMILCRMFEKLYGMLLDQGLYADLIHTITGWETDSKEVDQIGQRIWNLERCFLVREGISRKDDTLPHRIMHEPIPDGPSKGAHTKPEELKWMLNKYYEMRQWNPETGMPTEAKLRELGLSWAAQTLTKNN